MKQKICTSIEQSKELLKLGLSPDSADMMWTYDFMVGTQTTLNVINEFLKLEENDVPAWSLPALLDLMPKGEDLYYDMEFSDNEPCIIFEDWLNWKSENSFGKNYIDAAFEMVKWLIENDYIKTDKK